MRKTKHGSPAVAKSATLEGWLDDPRFREAWERFRHELDAAYMVKGDGHADLQTLAAAIHHLIQTVEDRAELLAPAIVTLQ